MCQLFTPLAFMEQSDSGSAHCGLQNNWTLAEAQLFLLVSLLPLAPLPGQSQVGAVKCFLEQRSACVHNCYA